MNTTELYDIEYEEISKEKNIFQRDNLKKQLDILIKNNFNQKVEEYSLIKNPDSIFPISSWSKYLKIEEEAFLKIYKSTPKNLYENLINELINIDATDCKQNPFLLHELLYPRYNCHEDMNLTQQDFQETIINKFVEQIPFYKKETAIFAFISLTRTQRYLSEDTLKLFNKLDNSTLDDFFKEGFHNNFTFSFFGKNNEFFQYLCLGFFDYTHTNKTNRIFDRLFENIEPIEPFNNNLYQTLFPHEVELIQKSNKIHQYYILNREVPTKDIQTKTKIKV